LIQGEDRLPCDESSKYLNSEQWFIFVVVSPGKTTLIGLRIGEKVQGVAYSSQVWVAVFRQGMRTWAVSIRLPFQPSVSPQEPSSFPMVSRDAICVSAESPVEARAFVLRASRSNLTNQAFDESCRVGSPNKPSIIFLLGSHIVAVLHASRGTGLRVQVCGVSFCDSYSRLDPSRVVGSL